MSTSRSIAIATPTVGSTVTGNHVTAARWAQHLQDLGHLAEIVPVTDGDAGNHPALRSTDVLVALHAKRSAAAIAKFDEVNPGRPIVLVLTGTDLHEDLPENPVARATVERADRLVVLQSAALDRLRRLDSSWADKAVVIHQSVTGHLPPRQPPFDEFRVVVLAHLREVKDPLLAARAAALMPAKSRVAVHHGGQALTDEWLLQATAEAGANARYVWHGELNAIAARELLASADVLACTSLTEGGANVVSEAIALGIPVVGSRIEGNVGLLGADHPGLFPAADAMALAETLDWLELSPKALADLAQRSIDRKHLIDPAVERDALATLVRSV